MEGSFSFLPYPPSRVSSAVAQQEPTTGDAQRGLTGGLVRSYTMGQRQPMGLPFFGVTTMTNAATQAFTGQIDLDRYTSKSEARAVRALVGLILSKGYQVSVWDGEEWTVRQSVDRPLILSAFASTEGDTLRVSTVDNQLVGNFHLLYQNGEGDEVVQDYSDRPACEVLWNEWQAKIA